MRAPTFRGWFFHVPQRLKWLTTVNSIRVDRRRYLQRQPTRTKKRQTSRWSTAGDNVKLYTLLYTLHEYVNISMEIDPYMDGYEFRKTSINRKYSFISFDFYCTRVKCFAKFSRILSRIDRENERSMLCE